jgi:hypothetical protein
MPVDTAIFKNSKFVSDVIRVRPKYPKFTNGLIKKTYIKYLPYFMKYIPNSDDMSLDELKTYIESSSWPMDKSVSITLEEARNTTGLPIICDACPFNKCVHLFPEIANTDLMRDVFGADSVWSHNVSVIYLKNPHLDEQFLCLKRPDDDIATIQTWITKLLKLHHVCVARAGFNGVGGTMRNIEVNSMINCIKSAWSFGETVSLNQARNNAMDWIWCHMCQFEQATCHHLFPERQNPALCAKRFKAHELSAKLTAAVARLKDNHLFHSVSRMMADYATWHTSGDEVCVDMDSIAPCRVARYENACGSAIVTYMVECINDASLCARNESKIIFGNVHIFGTFCAAANLITVAQLRANPTFMAILRVLTAQNVVPSMQHPVYILKNSQYFTAAQAFAPEPFKFIHDIVADPSRCWLAVEDIVFDATFFTELIKDV